MLTKKVLVVNILNMALFDIFKKSKDADASSPISKEIKAILLSISDVLVLGPMDASDLGKIITDIMAINNGRGLEEFRDLQQKLFLQKDP